MTAAEPTLGLRERKRLATRRAILLASIEVVRDRGFEAATVDEISRVADVSPRTFFNYFASKDEAILGTGPMLPDEAGLQEFVDARGSLFADLFEVLKPGVEKSVGDHDLVLLRRTVMKSEPTVAARRMATLHKFEFDVIALVARRLAAETGQDVDAPAVRDRARFVGLVAVAAMRHAWLCWMDAGEPDAAELLERLRWSLSQLEQLGAASVAR
ncbi:MAG TPA: TetR family transcriptional regulator [Pseudolysinimonas sp.]|nr:TetR family transcriptional regulator [Pseudolysinimonas sp.]